ncbi:hypothetical protein MSP8886_00573 [Marinomonas spartinae]|uniref:DUF6795 domain-containing protein n=1 Tax=Marinomonas spartinae TaxID=1792290 RepID=A0A1A8T3E4_9GAMM|nr:DUF6795 domain-containing protein [Marinomonas spartinae]SBS26332.1 hypothetical protein MSP8886_00573 [Marinomonas spartinae]
MFSFLKKENVTLCPEVHGKLLLNGTPLNNIEIIRSLNYIGEHEYTDSVISDSDGSFSFNSYSIKSRVPNKLFNESRIFQYIYADYDGKIYVIWKSKQPGYNVIFAYAKKLENMLCELSNPKVSFKFYDRTSSERSSLYEYSAHSICRWEDNFEISKVFND